MPKLFRSTRIENFDLQISKVSEKGFHAQVTDPIGGGVALWKFDDPFAGQPEIQEALLEVAGGCRDLKPAKLPSRDDAWELGTRLFQAVFGGIVLAFWNQRLLGERKAGRDLRLRFHLNAPEIWDWPWELLCDPDRGFLAVTPGTPIVRYIELPESVSPLPVRPPLHVLAVTASPPGLSPIGAEDELEDLEESLADLEAEDLVEIETLRGATRETLSRKLLERDFHVLHFIGHGAFDAGRGQGVIYLEKQDGSPDPVDGLELGVLLQVQPHLRLVVLNACHGARGGQASPFTSLMQSLVNARIPAVIGMQSAVTDRAASTFARHFYESLAQRKPVDGAVREARHTLFFLGSGDWGSPVLAMRAPDGRIFKLLWWENLFLDLKSILNPWRNWLVVLLLLLLLGMGFWSLARHWFDPNLLYAFLNPSECPAPHGIPIAFVKVEPSGKQPFCISRFEVTQRLWKRVMDKVPTRRHGSALPVVRVSWNDSQEFLSRLSKRKPGAVYRLPTGAEWVYAAQAGEGKTQKSIPGTANCENKDETDGYEGLAPVGSFPRNALGLYDMIGNVSEWVSDRDNWGAKRVRRGGSFDNVPENCSTAYRTSSKPDTPYPDTGFRIVRDPIPTK